MMMMMMMMIKKSKKMMMMMTMMMMQVKPVEEDRRPSAVYLDVIVRGAKENGLPKEYIEKLESIEHNGYRGEVAVTIDLKERTKIPD